MALRRGRREEDRPAVEIQLLGELQRAAWQAGLPPRRFRPTRRSTRQILRATGDETRLVYARPEVASVRVGHLRHDDELPAYLATDALLGKNLAILGSTGSGKSCAVTVVLRSLLDAYPFAHCW